MLKNQNLLLQLLFLHPPPSSAGGEILWLEILILVPLGLPGQGREPGGVSERPSSRGLGGNLRALGGRVEDSLPRHEQFPPEILEFVERPEIPQGLLSWPERPSGIREVSRDRGFPPSVEGGEWRRGKKLKILIFFIFPLLSLESSEGGVFSSRCGFSRYSRGTGEKHNLWDFLKNKVLMVTPLLGFPPLSAVSCLLPLSEKSLPTTDKRRRRERC